MAALAVERGKCEQKWKEWNISLSRYEKSNFYKTVLNACLSFLNEVKNLAKDTGVKYAFSVILCRILR